MLIRNESALVDATNPAECNNTPWRRFYTYCWKTYVKSSVLAWSDPTLDDALKLELEKFNAVMDVSSSKYNKLYTIAFIKDEDYTAFCLTW